jgi:asparagine synthase (glutamine-hydrolysing)
VPKRISDPRVADYLVPELEGADKTRTWFRDVRRMPPARAGTLSAAGISTREYWRPDTEKELTLSSDEEYTDAFEEVLKEAVKARMRSHKPVSSMLSGGVDSSTIVALARNIQAGTGGGPFATFSGVSEPGEDCRESRFCRRVIEQGGLEATLILPSQVVEFEDRLREIDRIMEDPFDLAWIHHRMIYLSARERGHVAVMDGVDGDGVASLTTAYPAYLLRDGQLLTAHRELIGKWNHYHRRTISLWKTYTDPLRLALVPEFLRKMKRSLLNRQPGWLEQSAPISSAFAASTQVAARQADFRRRVDLGRLDTLRQAHAKRITVPYLTAGIERYGRIAAACGVEQRQPFLDLRVIEHCLSLPWQQKSRNGWSKFGLRRVAERVLPTEVAWRTGWDSILWKFQSARDDLNRERIIEAASQDDEFKNRIFLAKNFDQLLDEYKIGGVDVADSVSNYVSLLHWMRNNGEPGE